MQATPEAIALRRETIIRKQWVGPHDRTESASFGRFVTAEKAFSGTQ